MTNEKMLEWCYTLKSRLNEADGELFDKCIKYPGIDLGVLPCDIANLIIAIKADMIMDEAKKAGRGGQLSAVKRILKNNFREEYKGAWMADGYQNIMDGYRAVRLRDPLNVPASVANAGYQYIDLAKIVDGAAQNNGEALTLPTVAELKAYIKDKKAKKETYRGRVHYDFGDCLPRVDANFLLDVMEALPNSTARASKHDPNYAPIYFECEHGDGILMPVRKTA